MSMTDFIGEKYEETYASLYDALAEMVLKNPDRAMIIAEY